MLVNNNCNNWIHHCSKLTSLYKTLTHPVREGQYHRKVGELKTLMHKTLTHHLHPHTYTTGMVTVADPGFWRGGGGGGGGAQWKVWL